MKRSTLIPIAVPCLLLLQACAPKILTKPDVYDVKKLAVVSVYVNREPHHIEDGGKQTNILKNLVRAELGGPYDDGLRQIGEHTLQVYAAQLDGQSQWKVFPPERMRADARYQEAARTGLEGTKLASLGTALQKAGGADYITPEGIHLIPIKSITSTDSTILFGKDTGHEQGQAYVADLAQKLGVDGVAIVEIDLGYRFGKFAKVKVGNKTRGKPSVASRLVIVRKDGKVVAKKISTERFEGESVNILKNNQVNMGDPEVVTSFNMAIAKSASAMRAAIDKEFSKK